MIPAYPLQWPTGWPRTASYRRTHGRFGTKKSSGSGWSSKQDLSIYEAVRRVRDELQRMGIRDDDLVVSTNLPTRLDGYPRSDARNPEDPGAAVYWRTKQGATLCMAIDRYQRVADNLAAIAATLDAMRAIERHGGATILDRAFTGFAALSPPADEAAHWSEVLGVARTAARDEIDRAYRAKRSAAHPDRGGSPAAFDAVQRAYEQATRT